MNQLFVVIALILLNTIGLAQAPDYYWAKSMAGTDADHGGRIISDKEGNIYVLGSFHSKSLQIGNRTLINEGSFGWDLFLAKYDFKGKEIWALSIGGEGWDWGGDIALDNNGNIYFAGTIESDTVKINGNTFISRLEGSDAIMVKFDRSGNVIWVKNYGGNAYGLGIDTDADGNIYFVGKFSSPSIDFDSIQLKPEGYTNIFIVKLDSQANVIWAKSIFGSGRGMQITIKIKVDGTGGICVAGSFNTDSIIIDAHKLYRNTGPYNYDIYLAKYDTSGNVIWANSYGGDLDDVIGSMTAGKDGDVYVTGYYISPTFSIGTTTLKNAWADTLANQFHDLFLARFDAAGNAMWAKTAGNLSRDYANDVALDGLGGVYITGVFNYTVSFGNGVKVDTGGLFIAKYDIDGKAIWAVAPSIIRKNSDIASGQGISCDNYGNVLAIGMFNHPAIIFGTTTLSNSAANGTSDVFIVKLGDKGVGIESVDPLFYPVVYPNPVGNILSVDIDNSIRDGVSITITDLMGKVLYHEKATGGRKEIDVSHLPSGMYFVNNRKFVKE